MHKRRLIPWDVRICSGGHEAVDGLRCRCGVMHCPCSLRGHHCAACGASPSLVLTNLSTKAENFAASSLLLGVVHDTSSSGISSAHGGKPGRGPWSMCEVCRAALQLWHLKGCTATEAADGPVLQVWQLRGCTAGVADRGTVLQARQPGGYAARVAASGAAMQWCQLGGCTAGVAVNEAALHAS